MLVQKIPSSNREHFLPNFCHSAFLLQLLIVMELAALVLFLANPHHPTPNTQWHWITFGLLSLFIQWITLSSAVILCSLRKFLIQFSPVISAVTCIVIVTGIICVCTALIYYIDIFLPFSTPFEPFWPSLSHNVIIGLIISGLILRDTYLQHQIFCQKQAALKSRLKFLQARIHPHFLFNSMNNIASIIPSNPGLAETLIEDLSMLLRSSLSEKNHISLIKEIDLAKRYLNLEHMRLGDRLHVHWCIPNDHVLANITVPNLLLQPLLENAVTHGIQPSLEQGTITIMMTIKAKWLIVTIKNTMPSEKNQHQSGHHIGLRNVKERLQAFYGHHGNLHVIHSPEAYEIIIKIPVSLCKHPK